MKCSCKFISKYLGLSIFFLALNGCSEEPLVIDAPPDNTIGFKILDKHGRPAFLTAADYRSNKPKGFYDEPYVITHSKEKIKLDLLQTYTTIGGLSFVNTNVNWDEIGDYFNYSLYHATEHMIWEIHFSEDRVDTMKFGPTKGLLRSLNCDTNSVAQGYLDLYDLFFLKYNSDTIIKGCFDTQFFTPGFINNNETDLILIPLNYD